MYISVTREEVEKVVKDLLPSLSTYFSYSCMSLNVSFSLRKQKLNLINEVCCILRFYIVGGDEVWIFLVIIKQF